MILSLVGHSGSGKTTVIEQWAWYLRDRGYRLGLAKHSHHAANLCAEGKDSQRLARCFPEWVVLASQDGIHGDGDLEPPAPGQDWKDYLERQSARVDLVLVEGGSLTDFPKIEVVRGREPRLAPEAVLARIGEGLEFGDPKGWTRFLVDKHLIRPKGVVNDLLTRCLPLAWHPQPWHAEVPWLAHDRLLGYDSSTRLVLGYRGIYLEGKACAFGAGFQETIASIPGLAQPLMKFRLPTGPFWETPLPRRGLPACWAPEVVEGYWRVVEGATSSLDGLGESLRNCARQYALDRHDPRPGLARLCQRLRRLPAAQADEGLPRSQSLLSATEKWLG